MIEEKNLPKFIRLGNNGTAMKLKKYECKNEFVYYRVAGNWSIGFRINIDTGKLYSNCPTLSHIHNKELIPTTYEDWKKDNGQYAN